MTRTKQNHKRISIFGSYKTDDLYSRNSEIIRAYINLGYEVSELRSVSNQSRNFGDSSSSFLSLAFHLFKGTFTYISLFRHFKAVRQNDVIYIPYPCHIDVCILKLCLIGKKPSTARN